MKRTALAAILLSLTCLTPAYAEGPYLYGAVGQSDTSLTNAPGLWRNEGMPYTTNLTDLAYKAGLGWTFASGVFIETGLVDPGSFGIASRFVSDHRYDPVKHRCKSECDKTSDMTMTNDMIGGEALAGYRHTFFEFFTPYAKAGMAGFAHDHRGSVQRSNQSRPVQFGPERDLGENLDGMVLAVAFGGGLCAPVVGLELCGDVTRYEYVAHTANPLTDGMTLAMVKVNIPLAVFTGAAGSTRDSLWPR